MRPIVRIELVGDEGDSTPSVGVILLTGERVDEHAQLKGEFNGLISEFFLNCPSVRLWCAFTTASMAIAHASTKHMKPKVSGSYHERQRLIGSRH
jgi:hypothetical protein